MQQIAYEPSPYLIFGYPQFLQAYDTATWDGYVKVPGGYPEYNGDALSYDTYIGVHPATAATTDTGGSTTWVWALVGAAVIVVIIVIVMLVSRRGREVESS